MVYEHDAVQAEDGSLRWTLPFLGATCELKATPAAEGSWSARAWTADGEACFTAGQLEVPEEGLAAFEAVLQFRAEGLVAASSELGLTVGALRSLTRIDRLLVAALPPGELVSRERLRMVRVDAGVGAELSEEALTKDVSRLRVKLLEMTDERVGIEPVPGRGYVLFDEGADDYLVAGPLKLSRRGQVAWVAGHRIKLFLGHVALVEHLMRTYLDGGPEAYAPWWELLILDAQALPAADDDDEARRRSVSHRMRELRRLIADIPNAGVSIETIWRKGYRLTFDPALETS